MFDHTHYVPILKGKEGEYNALRELTPAIKEGLTPLIEPIPIPYDFANEVPAKTVDEHLANFISKIVLNWGLGTIFFDLDWIPESERMADGRHPLKFIFDGARTAGSQAIPVTGLNRDAAYQDAVKDAIDSDHRGVCIRLESDDLDDLSTLGSQLDTLVAFFGVAKSDVDLLVDFAAIDPQSAVPMQIAASSIIGTLPSIMDWRTLTFAASAFPPDLSRLAANSVTPLPRTEWTIWLWLAARRARLRRLPTFGDYAIAHPGWTEVDPRLMKMSAQLRYTIDIEWLVFKARNTKDFGFGQFKQICAALIARPEYRGASFSWGDNAINDYANPSTGPGNATIWRKIGTNHHVTMVVTQIASVPGL
jgi:hypothetical protein